MKERTVAEKEKEDNNLSEKEKAVFEKEKKTPKVKTKRVLQEEVVGKKAKGEEGQKVDNPDFNIVKEDLSREK